MRRITHEVRAVTGRQAASFQKSQVALVQQRSGFHQRAPGMPRQTRMGQLPQLRVQRLKKRVEGVAFSTLRAADEFGDGAHACFF